MPIKRICQICKKEFWIKPSIIKRSKGKSCSQKCYYKSKEGCIPWNKGKIGVMPIPWNKGLKGFGKFNKGRKLPNCCGDKHHGWKGGKVNNGDGYILLYKPDHPLRDKRKYIFEHRFAMEKHLKRYLKPQEVVHHINNDRADNRLKNLKLFANNRKHLDFHRNLRYSPNAVSGVT